MSFAPLTTEHRRDTIDRQAEPVAAVPRSIGEAARERACKPPLSPKRLHSVHAARRFTALPHETLSALADRWNALEASGHCTAYQRLEWVQDLVDHLLDGSTAALFVEVRDAETGETLMIWPLAIVRHLGCRVVRWLDLGVSDYAAPLVARGLVLSEGEAAAAWAAVKAVLPRADLIDIARIPRWIGPMANPLAVLAGLRPSALHASGVTLDGDPETLIKRLASKSTVRDVTKARNRLNRRGEVTCVVADTDAMLDTLLDVLMADRRARFQKLGRFDLLARPAVEAFYRSAAKAGFASGQVRLFGLSVGGTWVAASYCLVHHGAVHGILLSMSGDEAWRKFSPGLVLVTENMIWARRQGLCFFDFTIGDLSYKGGLGGQPKEILDLSEPVSLVGACYLAIVQAASAAKARLAARPTLFARLKAVRQSLRRAAVLPA